VRRIRLIVACFIAGLAVGSGLTGLLTAHRVETLTLERDAVRLDLRTKKEELLRIEEELRKGKGHPADTIRSVSVRVVGVTGKSAVDIEGSLRDLLSALPGVAISRVDPTLFRDIVDGRLIALDGTLYRLQLLTAVIGPETEITVKVTPASL